MELTVNHAPPFTEEEWNACIRVLKVLARDPFCGPDTQTLKTLVAKIYKVAKKEIRAQNQQQIRAHDQALQQKTVVFQVNDATLPLGQHALPMMATEVPGTAASGAPSDTVGVRIQPERCYICKSFYHEVHFFYHLLCPECARLNHQKRQQRADLTGRIALVTGGRIKIGYQMCLRLLRDGARVIVTTRFPKDAVKRFAEEEDFSLWSERLEVHGLDFRNLVQLEGFIQDLKARLPHLDILINNAAQTVRRPAEFYQHLLPLETLPLASLPQSWQQVLRGPDQRVALELLAPQLPGSNLAPFFPAGQLDQDGQQLDFRPQNSWTATADQVSPLEMLEVQLVSNVAPFMLVSQLRSLLRQSPFERKFIVNVSAMEGQFARESKTEFHPHTNMAKAALNMLTRTSGQDYARDGIFMTSVDTGWITEENPHPKKSRLREGGFVTPLDVIDGMARIYDPIVQGLQTDPPLSGCFLKDYRPYPW
ncbi:SDR family NAD(P)-dependent oxidoreductase [Deinococcus cellulosilyticus]|uniref:Oxidoreductase n=1 Tax=Deinococcus cellulosilyticus (strain DSM 18568 / NBRC 106333 / KACC 11606 / 5516J-15) TaxID=1223518 RepID=A0A511N374_DEIC1|nr:SDR family oxidoreductase [Deinococcus cellulosilyticus]GEM46866.1 oxidoreductase [Deinococcus cellulosilyticus NBRC 106333 = KACC 11606]